MARARVSLSRSALQFNYHTLSKKVVGLNLLPMVKANAYGHDAVFAARSLQNEKNLQGFGVATFFEGLTLRSVLGRPDIPILVFSDCAPWDDTREALCKKFKLEPVFSELSSLREFERRLLRDRNLRAGSSTNAAKRGSSAHRSLAHAASIPAHLEINTGMNRLGVPLETISELKFSPKSIFTHLADADLPNAKVTLKQMGGLQTLIASSRAHHPHALLHFSNSSAIWNAKHFPLTKEMDFVRPGLSLYGIRPFSEAKGDVLKRVMHFHAPIINLISLKFGDQVGYGGTYTCKQKQGEKIAVLGAGYADGLFRSLSNGGIAVYGKKKFKLLGRVSMDLSAMDASPRMKIGDEVELWGDQIDPYEQAKHAGTIPYELTTRIGTRMEIHYD